MSSKTKKAWGGRFSKQSNRLLEEFNASIGFDQKLYAEDILGSQTHAEMLARIGVLTKAEAQKIIKGLDAVKKEIESGQFKWKIEDEDVHMAIESRLTQMIGAVGGKLHTGRSRNDQVALDFRLFCLKKIKNVSGLVVELQNALVTLADKKGFVPMPGYTHLQQAQPILWAHHLLAYVEMLKRDFSRLQDCHARANQCPLGSGALAGSTFALDRNFVAKKLGFDDVTHNSLDAVSDRDFVAEFLFALSLLSVHLSRFAEEMILWASQEFAFVQLPQEFCTGSSMMPQKVNPDVPELVRGKTGRILGHLVGLLTTIKGLPLAYNKDLQEDKEPLFDAVTQMEMILQILTAMVPGIEPKTKRMAEATRLGFLLATDVADYLVKKGIAFRQAHEVVGAMVRYCLEHETVLEDLPLAKLKTFSSAIDDDIVKWIDLQTSINRRKTVGATAAECVKKEVALAKAWIKKNS